MTNNSNKSDGNPYDWMSAGFSMWDMWSDMAVVIPMRMARIAGGGSKAERESTRMVAEKVEAHIELAVKLATGSLGSTPASIAKATTRHYGRKVKANRKRLTRARP